MRALAGWLDPILNPLACLPPPPEATAPEGAEVLLRRLEALLQNRLRYAISGEKRSIVRGQGLDFADLREYTPGDDIRKIDWNVLARTLTPHVREYHEEKQLTLWLAVDLTPSMHFGRERTKLQLAIELAGLLGLLAQQANHKLGAFLIGGQETRILPPRPGHGQVQHILSRLLEGSSAEPTAPAGDPFPAACQQLSHLVSKHSTVIVLSDFLSFSENWPLALGQLSRHSRLIHIALSDAVERALPPGLGLLAVEDPETGQTAQIDTSDPAFRAAYVEFIQTRQDRLRQHLGQTGTLVFAGTDEASTDILLRLIRAESARPQRRAP